MSSTLVEVGPRSTRAAAAVAVAAGCAVLALRPILAADGYPTLTLALIFCALLTVGSAWPLRRTTEPLPASYGWSAALALGIAGFAVARALGGGRAPAVGVGRVIALNTLAAVAEEAFFRRLTFDVLQAGGDAVAVVGSALLFALVHVTIYGWWVLPVDLAAGLVLGWQRQSSGRWWVPALTHAAANVMVVL